jgi:hypothetical protein
MMMDNITPIKNLMVIEIVKLIIIFDNLSE